MLLLLFFTWLIRGNPIMIPQNDNPMSNGSVRRGHPHSASTRQRYATDSEETSNPISWILMIIPITLEQVANYVKASNSKESTR